MVRFHFSHRPTRWVFSPPYVFDALDHTKPARSEPAAEVALVEQLELSRGPYLTLALCERPPFLTAARTGVPLPHARAIRGRQVARRVATGAVDGRHMVED